MSRRLAVRGREKDIVREKEMPIPRASKALSRFTVLDLTRVRSGPTCVRQLADWGANVIKIETPANLETGEPLGGPRDGPDFMNLHRNKRSITLNLKAPEGVAAFKKMVKKADVVVENFRPDVKDRLGIDYKTLRKVNPRIVYASISGFGQTGPYAERPGFDQIAQGMGGLMSITGIPGQGPVRVGIPVADLTAGLFCAMGILIALLERDTSGKGQHIETSLLQAQIFMLDFQAARWLVKGEVAKQAGNNHPTSIPTGVFKTKDGYINIASAGQKIWERFCQALGTPEWIARPEYSSVANRSKNRDALNAEIDVYTVNRTSADWVERFNKAGVPCGPIYAIDQMFADPQVKHVGIAQPVKTKDKKAMTLVGQPVSLSRTPSRLVAPPPGLGEHTGAVLKEFGFSAKQIAKLREANAI
jgi:crotonobetainyl-CoA:carnitine CoA-transferase CaiB-like acyl-CoA transferase